MLNELFEAGEYIFATKKGMEHPRRIHPAILLHDSSFNGMERFLTTIARFFLFHDDADAEEGRLRAEAALRMWCGHTPEGRAKSELAEQYAYLDEQLAAVLRETGDWLAGLANAASVLFLLLPDLNWAGFYLMKDGALSLGPFQGKPAVSRILPGSGVCGTAVQSGETQVVSNVHACENHIACDLNSRSEIVVPLKDGGRLFGVLDIDSPTLARFDGEDRQGLEAAARRISAWLADKI